MSDELNLYSPVNLNAYSLQDRTNLMQKVMDKAQEAGNALVADLEASNIFMRIDGVNNDQLKTFLQENYLYGQFLSDEYALMGFKALEIAANQGLIGKVSMSVSLTSALGAPQAEVNLTDLKNKPALESYGDAFAKHSRDVFISGQSQQSQSLQGFNGENVTLLKDHYDNFKMQVACHYAQKKLEKLTNEIMQDQQKADVLKNFKDQAQKAFTSERSKAMSGNHPQMVTNLPLTMIGEPKVSNGVYKQGPNAGKPYAIVEMSAYQSNYERDQQGNIIQRLKPTYYKLAFWGNDPSKQQLLANRFHDKAKIFVTGNLAEHPYVDKNGIQKVQYTLNVKDFSLPEKGQDQGELTQPQPNQAKSKQLQQEKEVSKPQVQNLAPNVKVTDLNLTLIGEPKVRSGTISNGPRAGQPYSFIELNAYHSLRKQNQPPTYYKLAIWNAEEASSQKLASMLKRNMQVTINGMQTDKAYTDDKGMQHVIHTINVDSFALNLVQPGLNKVVMQTEPELALKAQVIPIPQGEIKPHGATQDINGMRVTVVDKPRLQPGTVVPEQGPFAFIPCKVLEIDAVRSIKGPDHIEHNEPLKMTYVYPSNVANTYILSDRIQPGMSLRVSGSLVPGVSVDGRVVSTVNLSYIGLDLKQKNLSNLDFYVNLPQYGIPRDFKGDPKDYFYGRVEATPNKSVPQSQPAISQDNRSTMPRQEQVRQNGGLER